MLLYEKLKTSVKEAFRYVLYKSRLKGYPQLRPWDISADEDEDLGRPVIVLLGRAFQSQVAVGKKD